MADIISSPGRSGDRIHYGGKGEECPIKYGQPTQGNKGGIGVRGRFNLKQDIMGHWKRIKEGGEILA
jgi:hypothetical protein